jgi:hypothetical protein
MRDGLDNLMLCWQRTTDKWSPEGCPVALSRAQQIDLAGIAEEMGAERAERIIEFACENWDRINRTLGEGRWPRSPRIALVREFLEPIARSAGMHNAFGEAAA